jgi:hypothetical protein
VPQANIMAFEKSSWLMYPITSRTDATSLLFSPTEPLLRQAAACWSDRLLISCVSTEHLFKARGDLQRRWEARSYHWRREENFRCTCIPAC